MNAAPHPERVARLLAVASQLPIDVTTDAHAPEVTTEPAQEATPATGNHTTPGALHRLRSTAEPEHRLRAEPIPETTDPEPTEVVIAVLEPDRHQHSAWSAS